MNREIPSGLNKTMNPSLNSPKDTTIGIQPENLQNNRYSLTDRRYASPKNNSFSDVIVVDHETDQNIEVDLEKELEYESKGRLHTLVGGVSSMFNESSIRKITYGKNESEARGDDEDLFFESESDRIKIDKNCCFLCKNSSEIIELFSTSEVLRKDVDIREDDLIFPCLCNFKAHRECFRVYVLGKSIINCPKCSANYAITSRQAKHAISSKKDKIRVISILAIYILIVIGGIILLSNQFQKENSDANTSHSFSVTFSVIVIVILVLIGLGFLKYCWNKFYSKSIVNFDLFCKQTEIAFHGGDSEIAVEKVMRIESKKKVSDLLNRAKFVFSKFDLKDYDNLLSGKEEKIIAKAKYNYDSDDNKKILHNIPENILEEEIQRRKEIFISVGQIFGDQSANISSSRLFEYDNKHQPQNVPISEKNIEIASRNIEFKYDKKGTTKPKLNTSANKHKYENRVMGPGKSTKKHSNNKTIDKS